MFNWLGFLDRIKGQRPNRSQKRSPDPRAQSKNAEPTGGLDPLDGDISVAQFNFAKIELDYQENIDPSDAKHFNAGIDTHIKFDGPVGELDGDEKWIELISHSFGSKFLRPSVLIPALLAIGGCIALGFLLFGNDVNDDGGNASMSSLVFSDIEWPYEPAYTNDDPAEVGAPPTSIGGSAAEVATTPAPTVVQTVAPTTVAVVVTSAPPKSEVDPRFESCEQAMKEGFGPYLKGKDREYEWYPDDNRDGVVCDK